MRSLWIAAAAAAAAASEPAAAENWVRYGEAGGTILAYDADSVSLTGGAATVWVLQDNSRDPTAPADQHKSRVLHAIDCATSTVTFLAIVDYDARGAVTFRNDTFRVPARRSILHPSLRFF
jgi:hypothetical protein